jgi:branched-chain amino acid aminotransferase
MPARNLRCKLRKLVRKNPMLPGARGFRIYKSMDPAHVVLMTRLWCNGQWIDPLDFPVSPTDRGMTLGLGLFETILAIDGEPILADRHLARLRHSCERLGWPFAIPDLKDTMIELIEANDLSCGRSRLRLSISGGSGLVHSLTHGADHLVWMSAVPAANPPSATAVTLSPYLRNERSAITGLKCASYAENVVALEHAARLGFEETLFFNTSGHLCEAATANVFLVRNGSLITPSLASGCLPGITREVVLGMAARAGISCLESDVTMADLHSADELFLTSSIRGVMGVSRFDLRSFPPGPVTEILRKSWNQGLTRKIFD